MSETNWASPDKASTSSAHQKPISERVVLQFPEKHGYKLVCGILALRTPKDYVAALNTIRANGNLYDTQQIDLSSDTKLNRRLHELRCDSD